jgi:hypothetical protein
MEIIFIGHEENWNCPEKFWGSFFLKCSWLIPLDFFLCEHVEILTRLHYGYLYVSYIQVLLHYLFEDEYFLTSFKVMDLKSQGKEMSN